MKPFADNRIDYVMALAEPKKHHDILTVGISNIPEIEIKLEKKVKHCACIDLDKEKLNYAKKCLKNTTLILGDITNPNSLKGKKFDTIIMLEVLEHLEDDTESLKIIYSLLKKNGKLIISVPNKHLLHLFNPVRYTQHKRHYSMQEIESLLVKTGFRIKHKNTVESLKLLFDLYAHLFFKYIVRKKVKFGIFTSKIDRTYRQYNKESRGMDSMIVAVKS